MEVNFSCVPITAVHVCCVDDRLLLLSGQGSTFCIYDCETKRVLLRQRTFGSQIVHGIATRLASINAEEQPDIRDIQVLLWAGDAAAILCLDFIGPPGESRIALKVAHLFTVTISDWVLFGDFLEPDKIGVVRAYVVTAHNEVHEIVLDENQVTKRQSISCVRLVSGPGCVLYSVNARSESRGLLVAAGTVFGEVVVWTANKSETSDVWSSRILNIFLGHKGSIFGVCISENISFAGRQRNLLATCSDDRTIRLWTIDDEDGSKRDESFDGTVPSQLSDVTGFGGIETDSKSLLGMAWGHLSRIWTIKFLPTQFSSDLDRVYLISTGEDASFRVWEAVSDGTIFENKSELVQLGETASNTHHSGKNIWSSDCHYSGGKYVHYTGGADGSIVATTLRHTTAAMVDSRTTMSFDQISRQIETENQPSSISTQSATTLKQYAIAGHGLIIASTARGDLVFGKLEKEHTEITWRNFHTRQQKSPLLLCSDRDLGSVFFTIAGGSLSSIQQDTSEVITSSIAISSQATVMCIASRQVTGFFRGQESSILIPLPHECSVILLVVSIAASIHLESKAQLRLPAGFVPTSGCHHVQQGLLILGSRSGSIAIFDNLADLESATGVFSNIHGSDTVTSVMSLNDRKLLADQIAPNGVFILTTGRDGTYAVHEISRKSALTQSLTLQTVHRSSPLIGPNIEGAYFARAADDQSSDLVLYGFKSKDFVAWNETRQTEVLSVDCGGAHRCWAYRPNEVSGESTPGGTFVWTKASACHVYSKPAKDHQHVQSGGHGREIKAVAISSVSLESAHPGRDNALIVATGAEDTTIRLFTVKDGIPDQREGKNMICIRILNKHTTGIHHLEFSLCGKYLFSSGGCEELFVWRIHSQVPVIGVGVVLECMLPKAVGDADARITSFRVTRQKEQKSEEIETAGDHFMIRASYSNGKVKSFRYSREEGSRAGHFELLEEIVEGSFCLTQLHHDAKYEMLLTAGTNGFINVHLPQQDLSWKHQVHQNSIQASLLVKLPGSSCVWLAVTGGDDNALGLTIFCPRPDTVSSNTSGSAFQTLLIPKAHAAAVTGLALLSRSSTSDGSCILIFASVSNDQRVRVWRVTVLFGREKKVFKVDTEMQDIQVEKIAEFWTNVADAATIELLQYTPHNEICDTNSTEITAESSHEVIVGGVGMEILRIPISS